MKLWQTNTSSGTSVLVASSFPTQNMSDTVTVHSLPPSWSPPSPAEGSRHVLQELDGLHQHWSQLVLAGQPISMVQSVEQPGGPERGAHSVLQNCH